MNRLNLRLYTPPETTTNNNESEPTEKREILPFVPRGRGTVISGRMTAPVDRARIIHENSTCPECSRCNIEPLELQDAVISPKSRLPIPGTSTIVGFHCTDCGTEWPVYELVRRNG